MKDFIQSYELHTKALDAILDSVKSFVRSHGNFVNFNPYSGAYGEAPRVITTEIRDGYNADLHFESICYAIMIDEDDDLVMFARPAMETYFEEYTEEQLRDIDWNSGNFYIVDWDSSHLFQYNIERIAYFLAYNYVENSI